MRKISFILLISLLLTLVSCGSEMVASNVPTRELLSAVLPLFSEKEQSQPAIYYSDADEGSDNYLDPETMSFLFLGEFGAEIPALSVIEEYAMAAPLGINVFEIDIFKASSQSDALTVRELLEERLEIKQRDRGQMEKYDPAQLPALDDASVNVVGTYVILTATSDNTAVMDKITGLLGTVSDDSIEPDSVETTDAPVPDVPAVDMSNVKTAESIVNASLLGEGKTFVGASKSTGEKSPPPTLSLTMHSGNKLVILGGKCGEGATIRVYGGKYDYVFGSDNTDFMVEVEINDGVNAMYLTQEIPGMAESLPIQITALSRTDVNFSDRGVCQVSVGDGMQCHFKGQLDWAMQPKFSEKQLDSITARMQEKVDYLETLGCELVYMIAASPNSVYPENAPARYDIPDYADTRTPQIIEAAKTAGATVIDLYDVLREHRNDEHKVYHKTESHWTDYGAYVATAALVDHIDDTWADIRLPEIGKDLQFVHRETNGGDMTVHLKVDYSVIKETSSYVEWLTEPVDAPDVYLDGTNGHDVKDHFKLYNVIKNPKATGDVPTCMVIRDSFSFNIFGFFNECFSEVTWAQSWSYSFNKSAIEEAMPDYYIVLVTERNLNSILN